MEIERGEKIWKYVVTIPCQLFAVSTLLMVLGVGTHMCLFGFEDHKREVEDFQRRISHLHEVYSPEVRASDERLFQQFENWYKQRGLDIPYT